MNTQNDAGAERLPQIVVFDDPVCPWCLLGLYRLDRAIERAGLQDSVEIVHQAFLLDPNTPEEGEDVVEMLTRKYGRAPDEAWDRIESEARKSGLEVDMRKQTWRYPSQKAQVLIQLARGMRVQHPIAIDLGRACYLEGEDISSDEVLVEIGTRHGLAEEVIRTAISVPENIAAVERMAQEAIGIGVNAVPVFLFDRHFSANGAQPDAFFDAALKKMMELGTEDVKSA